MGYVLEATYRHGTGVSLLRSPEDIARFVDELLAAGWEYTAATVYAVDEANDGDPDHELTVGADSEIGLGAVRYTGESGTWYSQGDRVNPNGVTFYYFGNDHQFPADAEVPLDTVRAAMWELLTRQGQRPDCLTWQQLEE
jgi:hypothetical protein